MNLTPFQIRLELLKMAKELLTDEYYGKKDHLTLEWQTRIEYARQTGQTLPEIPSIPAYPTEQDVIKKAQELNNFISQVPMDIKTSRKPIKT